MSVHLYTTARRSVIGLSNLFVELIGRKMVFIASLCI